MSVDWSGKRVAVIGASGFLGRYFTPLLAEAGAQVLALDRVEMPALQGVQTAQVDITDASSTYDAVAGQDYVFHFAGIADIEDCNADPARAVRVNILGLANVLEGCRAHSIKRVFFASSVYAASRLGGVYRTTKKACELLLDDYAELHRLAYTSIRVGTVYGPDSDPRNSIYRYARQALTEGAITYHGAGDESREYIHIEDTARLLLRLIDSAYENKIVMITGQHPTKVADLFNLIGDILGREIKVEFGAADKRKKSHYKNTPFSFQPERAVKLHPSESVDLGQGVLNVIEHIHEQIQTS